MKVLFVHQNFPGQYRHLARHLGIVGGNEIVFLTQHLNTPLDGVKRVVYQPLRRITAGIHHYLRDTEMGVLNAQAVVRKALELKRSGFVPDVMLGHNGWGEIWYLKEVFPTSPLIGYFEFFYRREGADIGFDPLESVIPDTGPRMRTKNLGNLLGLDASDVGQTPTHWQKSLYPSLYHSKLHVVHEGINTEIVAPNPTARLRIPDKEIELSSSDEIVTYVARNLEPYRGFPSFMRSLPETQAQRPNAHVIIVGGDQTSYGPPLSQGKTFRQQMLEEVGSSLDMRRVHFLGKVSYSTFLTILQISSAHVYLTYPFVLSWSMLEAMAAGCLVIGSKTAPVEEVIRDGENGVLVDFFSPGDIAKRVVDALENRRDYHRIRQLARQTIIDKFDLKTICLPSQLHLLDIARETLHP